MVIGGLVYLYGWRFLTFDLIGGLTSRLLGGRYQDNSEAQENKPEVVPPHLDVQSAVEQLPDFHATVAKNRSQKRLMAQPSQPATDVRDSDANFTVDPGAALDKSDYGVRYSRERPGRVLRDRRYQRVRGPDSGDDPDVYHGMFEKKGDE
jgi:hypothetical protein